MLAFLLAISWSISVCNACLSVCTEGGGVHIGLFKRAIQGNEHILAERIDVESGLWRHLQARKVLIEEQIQLCRSEVFGSIIFALWKISVTISLYSATRMLAINVSVPNLTVARIE